jgi:hypothetical protein
VFELSTKILVRFRKVSNYKNSGYLVFEDRREYVLHCGGGGGPGPPPPLPVADTGSPTGGSPNFVKSPGVMHINLELSPF